MKLCTLFFSFNNNDKLGDNNGAVKAEFFEITLRIQKKANLLKHLTLDWVLKKIIIELNPINMPTTVTSCDEVNLLTNTNIIMKSRLLFLTLF